MAEELAELVSKLMTPATMADLEAKATHSLERNLSTESQNIRVISPDPAKTQTLPKDLNTYEPAEFQSTWEKMIKKSMSQRYPPPNTLQCANVQAMKYQVCAKPGTMACSACRLVSYCSQECQKAHWKLHKGDCKNPMMSANWQPIWMRERRPPTFITDESGTEEFQRKRKEEFSAGMSLWGNTSAMDVINLAGNEKDPKKDFSLAFIASGDLRHLLRTFNALPADYSGKLNILLNDFNPVIFCRNVVLLLILANVPDETIAADMALHFWYSTFIPSEYRLQLSAILLSFLKQASTTVALGPRSKLSTTFPKEVAMFFSHFISSSLSIANIQDEYNRVRTAPSRRDFRDRMYLGLKPAHRVAFQEFRRFGIVLPFGAMNSHFNCPNLSLFSTDGKWLQTDYADPLEGWDTVAIIEAGKAHGAHSEDIYGCLYFFLSKELRTFANRLRTFSSSFTILNCDARLLPPLIRDNALSELNLPSSIKFDRIEVSNIFDENYVGIHDVLTLWAPLLHDSRSAAIVGYFMNWVFSKKSQAGRATSAGRRVVVDLIRRVMAKEKVKPSNYTEAEAEMSACMSSMDAFYENSQPFSKFLQNNGLDDLLRKTRLRLRERHAIVPHRVLAPLGGATTALPQFSDDAWYYYTKVTSWTWSERYVEFQHDNEFA